MNNPLVTWIVSRAKEPSTWAGMAVFVSGLNFLPHADTLAQLIPSFGAFAAAALAVLMPEAKKA